MELTSGARLRSTMCGTEVIVVRPPASPVDLRCGGSPMVVAQGDATPTGSPAPGFDDGTAMGKRFEDPDSGLELLCVAPGEGSLSLGDQPLLLKGAKPLPASD